MTYQDPSFFCIKSQSIKINNYFRFYLTVYIKLNFKYEKNLVIDIV